MWTDTHCHVPWTDRDGTLVLDDSVLDEARSAGVGRFVSVGTDAATSRRALEAAGRHADVWATAGVHPHDAAGADLEAVERLLDQPRIVAVGECGLDFHYDHSPRDVQAEVFAAQIGLALQHDLTLVIHTREAWPETFDILHAEGVPARTVFHCFTGGPDEARRCLDLGAVLSFSGIVTFPGATELHDAARLCPLERLLVETDSPYLAPVPHRGKPNQPAWVVHVGETLARLKGIATEDVARSTWGTAHATYRLPPG
jgi:TatD DNase family protein